MPMEIKSLSSPDVDIDVWEAESKNDVFFVLELEIGLAGSSKADLFEGRRSHAGRAAPAST